MALKGRRGPKKVAKKQTPDDTLNETPKRARGRKRKTQLPLTAASSAPDEPTAKMSNNNDTSNELTTAVGPDSNLLNEPLLPKKRGRPRKAANKANSSPCTSSAGAAECNMPGDDTTPGPPAPAARNVLLLESPKAHCSQMTDESRRRLKEAKERYNKECDEEDRRLKEGLNVERPDSDNSSTSSGTADELNDEPSAVIAGSSSDGITVRKVFGFIGLNRISFGLVRKLIEGSFEVYVWDESAELQDEVAQMGATPRSTPKLVAAAADIIFCFSNDCQSALSAFCEGEGALGKVASKAVVQQSGIQTETSHTLCHLITLYGGRYLEAQFIGTHLDARNGRLLWVASGDRSVFIELDEIVSSCCIYAKYLGPTIGKAISMRLVYNLQSGILTAGLAECLTICQRSGVDSEDFLSYHGYNSASSEFVMETGRRMIDVLLPAPDDFHQPFMEVRRDLSLAVGAQNQEKSFGPLPLSSAALQQFVRASQLGYGRDSDASAIIHYVKM